MPDAQAELELAVLYDRKDIRHALKLFEVKLSMCDTVSVLAVYKAIISQNERRNRRILKHAIEQVGDVFKVAAILDSTDIEQQLLLMRILTEEERYEDCDSLYQRLIRTTNDRWVWENYLGYLEGQYEYDRWLSEMQQYFQLAEHLVGRSQYRWTLEEVNVGFNPIELEFGRDGQE